MFTPTRDIRDVAMNFSGMAHLNTNMGRKKEIPLRTAVIAEFLVSEYSSLLRIRIATLRKELRLDTAPNRANAEEELRDSLWIIKMLENNCSMALREATDEFHKNR